MTALSTGGLVLSVLLLAHWFALALRIRRGSRPLPALPDAPDSTAGGPAVSVVVAVRNESDRLLETSLQSMIGQQYPSIEVLAVDDHSTDDSRAKLRTLAAANARLCLLDAGPLDHGKRAALAMAARQACGDWLLFTDADVLLSPSAVNRAMAFATHTGIDALSLLPRSLAIGFWEQVALAATGWLAFEGPALARCNDDAAPVGLAAAGPFLLVRRIAYEAIGGYDAIRRNVLVDVELARTLRAAGFRYRYLASDGEVTTRMYRSLGELWRGFIKNAWLALGGRAAQGIAASFAVVALLGLPPALALYFGFSGGHGATKIAGLACAIAALACMLHAQAGGARFMGARLRAFPLVLSFLGAGLWVALVAASAWAVGVKGKVVWRGQTLEVTARDEESRT